MKEKIIILCKLGSKYLNRYRRRYAFLLAAMIFCFGIITFITSTKDRMYDNLYYKAQSHYSGDIVAVGYNNYYNISHFLSADEISSITGAIDESGINPSNIVKRTIFSNTGVVYYNGISVTQKYVIGCDWEDEAFLFSKMDFSSPLLRQIGDDSIIISEPVAMQLNSAIGDILTLEVGNKWGQKNTAQFIVSGIVRDSSIFAYYKVYISRLSLNRLMSYDDDDCSMIGLFLSKPAGAEEKRSVLHNVLKSKIQTGPLVYNREGMDRELEKPWQWENTKVLLFTLPVYLSEIANLMDAMNMLTYLLYAMMLIIVFVSASVTYRLILHERTKEMGVMRAIGFYGTDIQMILWTEILILGIISLFAGFIFSVIISAGASFISFSWFSGFEIFLRNGRLTALYLPGTIILNIIFIFIILIMAVFVPALRASRKNLPSLLSGEPL